MLKTKPDNLALNLAPFDRRTLSDKTRAALVSSMLGPCHHPPVAIVATDAPPSQAVRLS